MPVLFLHAAWDANCDTLTSTLAEPMRAHCDLLDEVTLQCGHWMPEERPREVNAAIVGWLARRFGGLWRS
jgi:pimeloyl-ACP methyl ester carboxylesterase